MHKFKLLAIISCLSLAGCNMSDFFSEDTLDQQPEASIVQEMGTASYQVALLNYKQGNYNRAIIEFRKVIQATKDSELVNDCLIGIAKSLIKKKQYAAAVVTLKPLDLNPISSRQREILAIAGEALLRLERYKEAECVLEIALDDMKQKQADLESWRAPCCANLACAYLKNNKLPKAAIMYKKAAVMFKLSGNIIASKTLLRMQNDIELMLRQYAPFKPLPVTPDLPAGK